MAQPRWDVFVSHASEDKAAVARPLAEELRGRGLNVWYDEYELRVGDSLLRKINEGLANSRRAIVILSPNFFAKHWAGEELAGLSVLEATSGERRLLPVWHELSHADVAAAAPMLADRFAVTTAEPIERVAVKLIEALENSALTGGLPVVALIVEIAETTPNEVRLRLRNVSSVHATRVTLEPREVSGRGVPLTSRGPQTIMANTTEVCVMSRFPPSGTAAEAQWDLLYADPADRVLKRHRLVFSLHHDVVSMKEFTALAMDATAVQETLAADDLKPWPQNARNIVQAFLFADGWLLSGSTRYIVPCAYSKEPNQTHSVSHEVDGLLSSRKVLAAAFAGRPSQPREPDRRAAVGHGQIPAEAGTTASTSD